MAPARDSADWRTHPLALVDAHMVGRNETGNETYIRGLLAGLAELGRPQAVAIDPAMAAAPDVDLQAHILLPLRTRSDVRRLLVELPRLARETGADVVHSTYFPAPFLDRPAVVTVHDVSFARYPEWFTPRDRAVLTAGVRLTARTAARMIVPSLHARDELCDAFGVAPERVAVTPEGVSPCFRPASEEAVAAARDTYGTGEQYVLAVGNLQPRKNIRRLLQAWRQIRAAGIASHRLVLAGGLHGRHEPIDDLLTDPLLESSVVRLGYVPMADLPALYSGADAFVLPSLYEGFGLPVLEAMACGTPVACAAAASLPEVAGDAAAMFDPMDADEIAGVLAALIADAGLRSRLGKLGTARARAFTWRACAEATLTAYEEAALVKPARTGGGRAGTSIRRRVPGIDKRPRPADRQERQPASGPLRIALVGTRGVPAAYSGFETAVENLGTRLAARGHDVTVYCRPHMVEGRYDVYRGMRLVYLPTIASKHLDTFVHTFLSTLHMGLFSRRDAAVYFIAGNAPFAGISRVLGIPSAINVDGLDSRRAKWGGPARRYIRWAEHNAPRLANRVITDSRVLHRIYGEEHGAETDFIPYGADMPPVDDADERVRELGLEPGGYLLFVGRLVPENNAHVLIEAFGRLASAGTLPPGLHLAIVGDAAYSTEYIEALHEQARAIEAASSIPQVNDSRAADDAAQGGENDGGRQLPAAAGSVSPGSSPDHSAPGGRAARQLGNRIVFPGYQFGEAYRSLARNCLLFVIPTEVGGTHPVLLEAMAAGSCIVVNDHEPNLEALGDAGESYAGAEGAPALSRTIAALLTDAARREDLRRRAAERAHSLYSWDAVTDSYERLIRQLAGK